MHSGAMNSAKRADSPAKAAAITTAIAAGWPLPVVAEATSGAGGSRAAAVDLDQEQCFVLEALDSMLADFGWPGGGQASSGCSNGEPMPHS